MPKIPPLVDWIRSIWQEIGRDLLVAKHAVIDRYPDGVWPALALKHREPFGMADGKVLLESGNRVVIKVRAIRPQVRTDVAMAWSVTVVGKFLGDPVVLVHAVRRQDDLLGI